MSLIPTSSMKVTRQVQFYPETNGYQTAVVNPTFQNAGIINSVDIAVTIDHEMVRIQGSRKQYADIQMGVEGVITLGYRLLDTVLFRYGITDPAGAGTIGESLCFLFARKLNNVEEFCLAKGCITESVAFTGDRVPNITQVFYSPSISNWLTLSQLQAQLGIGTGTPQFAAPITAAPWTHLTGSDTLSTSITVNGVATDIIKMTVNVTNNLFKQKPMGYKRVKYIEAGNKTVTVTLEPYLYDNTFMDLTTAFTVFNITMVLKASTPQVILTITGLTLNSYNDKTDAGTGSAGGEFLSIPVNGTAVDLSVTAYP